MPEYGAVIAFLLLIIMVISRAVMLKKQGIQAMVFARTHKSDWILPPIVFFFVYHIFANAFDWPRISGPNFVDWTWPGWIGCVICALGITLFYWGVFSFGRSFRVGIDDEKPGELVTTGAFAFTRNPLYVAFGLEVTGFFCIFPNPMFLFVMCAGFWLFHRQIIREEEFLQKEYGEAFNNYCKNVRRYF